LSRSRPLSVLIDEGAPVLAGVPFAARGHRVIQHGEAPALGAKDPLVCATAI
jgi:hypothetical protein